MSHFMTDLSWLTFRERVPSQTDLVIVPVGTIEAHGGSPLGTDNIIPGAMARDLAPRLGALIAPPVPYGVTDSLLPYPGSTTVSSRTFEAYLFEAVAGLVRAGFRRVVLLNGHGGQTSEVNRVVGRLWDETEAFTVAVEWWGLAEQISYEVYGEVASGHAGVEETAMVMAVAPETIDEKRATTARRVPRRPGVKARPFPASVILNRPEKREGEGAPILDADKAAEFYRRTLDEVESALLEVFAGWEDLRT
jgi:creatinine amidohydrolase